MYLTDDNTNKEITNFYQVNDVFEVGMLSLEDTFIQKTLSTQLPEILVVSSKMFMRKLVYFINKRAVILN